MGIFSRDKPKDPQHATASIPVGKPPGEENLSGKVRKADIEVLLQDLAAGAEYQQALMAPVPQNVAGYDFGIVYRGARNVSGDFYDFIVRPDGRLAIAIADASGKGIPASLLGMSCRSLLRAQPEPTAGPAQVMANVNRMMAGNIKRGMFVSAVYALLDPKTHTLTVANAGHLPVVVWKSKAKMALTYPSKGPVLGVVPPNAYLAGMKEDVIPLDPGDRFVLITDGVNEAMAPGQAEFGMEHLRRRLMAESDGKSAELLKRIVDQIDIHRAGADQSDDITILTGRRTA